MCCLDGLVCLSSLKIGLPEPQKCVEQWPFRLFQEFWAIIFHTFRVQVQDKEGERIQEPGGRAHLANPSPSLDSRMLYRSKLLPNEV